MLSKKFNWYPGHIAKAEKELKEKIKIIDLIIEIRDARIPEASHHKDLEEWANNKTVITILNKSDLADTAKLKTFINNSTNKIFLFNNKQSNKFLKPLLEEIKKFADKQNAKFKEKGVINKPLKVLIAGYPNVGKSSIINLLAKSKKTKVADKPGVTRAQQWVDVKGLVNIKLLDTPGIIPTKLYSDEQALRLALCNCVSDQAYDPVEVARMGIELIEKLYPGLIAKYYGLDEDQELSLENIALAKKLLLNGEADKERAARRFIRDFQDGKIGALILD